ncbi:MAG: putative zinc-finger [Actinomycetota bacterium]|jgi:hypothetical protein|nr:putative zinc-finger [Actinomycetota bacterium]
MTCEDVRERLSDHLLGTLAEHDADEVAAHLRGCAACRAEVTALGDGLAAFASAAHDREPPDELKMRVTDVLQAEWASVPAVVGGPRRPRASWLAAAAAVLAILVSTVWGLSERHNAISASADAASYTKVLQTLGGKEFRAGTLTPSDGVTLEGSVLVYDSHQDQSWAAVFVRAPGRVGRLTAILDAPDGRTITISPMKIRSDGDGSCWIVTSADLTVFDHLTVRDASGTVIATAEIDTD